MILLFPWQIGGGESSEFFNFKETYSCTQCIIMLMYVNYQHNLIHRETGFFPARFHPGLSNFRLRNERETLRTHSTTATAHIYIDARRVDMPTRISPYACAWAMCGTCVNQRSESAQSMSPWHSPETWDHYCSPLICIKDKASCYICAEKPSLLFLSLQCLREEFWRWLCFCQTTEAIPATLELCIWVGLCCIRCFFHSFFFHVTVQPCHSIKQIDDDAWAYLRFLFQKNKNHDFNRPALTQRKVFTSQIQSKTVHHQVRSTCYPSEIIDLFCSSKLYVRNINDSEWIAILPPATLLAGTV